MREQEPRAIGSEVSVARPGSILRFCRKRGGGVFLREIPPMWLMDLVLVGGYLAFLCAFVHFCCVYRCGVEAGTNFRISACMESVLWTTALIVRFWGIILGRVGPIFLRS
jgi:hypothetical protein